MEINVTSPAFSNGGMIPGKFTCDGPDVSPPLSWSHLPKGTRSIAMICDDPDAPVGDWVHWVVYNLPADSDGLSENISADEIRRMGGKEGINDFRKTSYGGPCPPGGVHRYYFKVFALDDVLSLSWGVSKGELLRAMKGHILGQGQLVGKYQRKR